MPIGNKKPRMSKVLSPEPIHTESDQAEKIQLAKEITDLALGGEACTQSVVRLARLHTKDQLQDLLYLLESFKEKSCPPNNN